MNFQDDYPNFEIYSDYSNWIIPGKVMCGPYPYCDGINFNEEEGKKNIQAILRDGIDTFVCLCREISLEGKEKEDQTDKVRGRDQTDKVRGRAHPYFPQFKSYRDYISSLKLEKMITFKYYPIDDGGIPEIKDLVTQIEELRKLLSEGKRIYIHCAGGHGRTNIYTSILVSSIFNVIPEVALDHVFEQRKLRRKKDKKLEIYNIPEDDRYIIFNKTQEEMVKIVSHYFLVKNQLEF